MLLGRPFAALICIGLAAASSLKHVEPDEPHSAVEYSYRSPSGQVPLRDVNQGGAGAWPYHPPEKDETRTIYQVLNDNDKFSRLVKVINFSEEVVKLLNDSSVGITFFAPPNRALSPPRHRKKHHKHDRFSALSQEDPAALLNTYTTYSLAEIVAEIEDLESALADDPDKERKKKIIKIIVRAILQYHILPQIADLGVLTYNTTHATSLIIPDKALDGEALRIRVGAKLIPPSVNVNFFSTVVKPNIFVKNGVIHVINHPLLPPPSIFQTLFLIPRAFGTLTSAVQRVQLTNAVEWRYVRDHGSDKKWTVEGTGSTTFFVPSNLAFKKLPWKLELFLFSPFGERVLKKLLQFHVVPGIVLHTDYLHNVTSGETISVNDWTQDSDAEGYNYNEESFDEELHFTNAHFPGGHEGSKVCKCRKGGYKPGPPLPPPAKGTRHPHGGPLPPPPRGPPGEGHCKAHGPLHHPTGPHKPVFAANVTLHTLLSNHHLHAHIAKFKHHLPIPSHRADVYVTKLFVNHQSVTVADVTASNGAMHVIGNVLSPHPRHGHREKGVVDEGYDSWEDWEDWLVEWADEN